MTLRSRVKLPFLVALLFMGFLYSMFLGASVFKAEGAIESTSGGFVFPDGSVQATAALESCTPITYVPFVISEEGVYCLTGNLDPK